ncbi:MAG: phospholipase [Bacteroidaceae bacterium]|jgi:hypothetical protein|nr:phospholipase [Muribaculaceae bacterium]MBR5511000.1 phospholipase [Bacteroidaceae bacterium]MBO7165095.1 phospholipase [Muribaculaceae bacterium]MBQ1185883.1 phospholipase [Muribaculaceae bacterium]MBQ2371160.1 phospholipase [Muribaculaceae bacterium]
MKAALIILALIVVVGLLAWLLDKIFYRRLMVKEGGSCDEEATAAEEEETECCGMHAVCEKDLLSPVSDEYEYYDDEELDAYRGRGAESYTDEEVEQFRDVLLTLRPDDVAGWSRSMQLRGIELPTEVREELLMIVGEQRDKRQ